MNVYVVRHADARPLGGTITTDDERPLSARGEHDARVMARLLARVEPQAPLFVCSPLLRARNTATLLGEPFATQATIEIWDELEPGIRFKDVLSRLQGSTARTVVLVGHQPDMSHLLSYLIADGATEIALPPGAMASLTLPPGTGSGSARLHWLVTPDLITLLTPTNV
jgi:phosphohistidine phosphatase